jgi:hypothetical protein
MKYMLLCYDDEQAWERLGGAAMQDAMSEAVALTHELHARGQYHRAAPLHPSSSATCVRIRDGKRMITDGPFAETREVLGGFYLLDVDTLEEALDIAARHPGARLGAVEVRPVLEIPNLPQAPTANQATTR